MTQTHISMISGGVLVHFNGCDMARMNMYVCVCISAALSKDTELGLEWTGATRTFV